MPRPSNEDLKDPEKIPLDVRFMIPVERQYKTGLREPIFAARVDDDYLVLTRPAGDPETRDIISAGEFDATYRTIAHNATVNSIDEALPRVASSAISSPQAQTLHPATRQPGQ